MELQREKTFSVSELTTAIKNLLEPYFSFLSVKGEISNFKIHSSGHIYFTLKDETSQLFCALFRGNAKALKKMPKDGDLVTVKGELSIYPARGNYQLIVKELNFSGAGELLLKLQELKEKLKNQGWFDPGRKKKIPKIPGKIGIVTSPTGAVIRDVINVLSRRFENFHLILNPVKVQGEGAKEEISKAIYDFNKYRLVDLIIIARGGGSLEDLWAFNEELVAKAIYESEIPTISAVGHETDFSISDFVADLRAPTPSAAAELAILEKAELLNFLKRTNQHLVSHASQKVKNYRQLFLALLKQPSLSTPYTLLGKPMQKLDDIKSRLNTILRALLEKKKLLLLSISKRALLLSPRIELQKQRKELLKIKNNLRQASFCLIKEKKETFIKRNFYKNIVLYFFKSAKDKYEKLQKLTSHLTSIDPKNLLKKGYSIVFSEKDNSIILSLENISIDSKVKVMLGEGSFKATVNEIIGEK